MAWLLLDESTAGMALDYAMLRGDRREARAAFERALATRGDPQVRRLLELRMKRAMARAKSLHGSG